MALQQTLISLQSGPVEMRLARVLEELDHLLPTALFRAAGCFLRLVLLTRLHAKFSTLNSTWLGPVCDTYTISPAGSGLCPFSRTTPPPST
jgi:hypothetical protein